MNIKVSELGISTSDIENENDKDKLLKYKRVIDFIISDIKGKVDDYKVEFIENGVRDYKWLKKANSKRRLYLFVSQTIDSRLRINKTKEKEKFQNNIGNLFIKNSREMLPKDMFSKIFIKSLDDVK